VRLDFERQAIGASEARGRRLEGRDQLRMHRIREAEELEVERKRRVVPARAGVEKATAAEGHLDQQLLLRPDAQFARGDADRLTGGVRNSDARRNLADHSRFGRILNVDDLDPRTYVRTCAVRIRGR